MIEYDIEKHKPLYPILEKKVQKLLTEAHRAGLTVWVFSGFRTFAAQAKLYSVGGVTNAKAGLSWHNYGLACDLVFKDSRGRWSWSQEHNWALLGSIGKKCGLEWGGDFKRIKDLCHFQLTGGLKIQQALRLYKIGGLLAVWNKLKELL